MCSRIANKIQNSLCSMKYLKILNKIQLKEMEKVSLESVNTM